MQDLRQLQLHLLLHHPVACLNVRPLPSLVTVVPRKDICPQVSRTVLNSTSRALLLGLRLRKDLDLHLVPQGLHQLSSTASGGRPGPDPLVNL